MKTKSQAAALRIGISGWAYPHWKEHFYPREVKDSGRLAFYAQHFDTIELNSTFYRLPAPALFERWRDAVPAGFLFAVKGSRLMSHYQHLQSSAEEVGNFFQTVGILGDKLGPVLFQLPPDWPCDIVALENFLCLIPSGFRVVFECRNPTWWTAPVFALLEKHHVAFCIFDLKGKTSPAPVTADFIYVRLHGPRRPYMDRYPEEVLHQWKVRVDAWLTSGLPVYFYFNNTEKARATVDARLLKELLVSSPGA